MGAPPYDRRAMDIRLAPPAPAAPAAEPSAEVDLPLDQEELDMLAIFHKSFNLPGLRLGLVKPVLEGDYYPPDEDFADEAPPEPVAEAQDVWEEPSFADELAALRAETQALTMRASAMLPAEEAWVPEERQAARPHSRSVRRPGSGRR